MSSAWVCPACGRRVPPAVDLCRCGSSRPSDPVASSGAASGVLPVSWPTHTVSHRAFAVLIAAVFVLSAFGLLFWRTNRGSGHGEPATPAVDSPEAARSRPSEMTDAAVSRPHWPEDASLWREPSIPAAAIPGRPTAPARAPANLEDIVSAALPAIVLVETPAGRGTGFFIASDTVVTNAHVVEGATYVTLRLASGAEAAAMVTVRSEELDLAALRVTKLPTEQSALRLGALADVRVGEEVIAIGSPLGLQNTVTRGIVSGLRRAGAVTLVQTDAAINPGNSGGPILDRSGRVVAIATMRIAGRAEALGFGVAAEHVRELLDGGAQALVGRSPRPAEALRPDVPDADADRQAAAQEYERFVSEAARRAAELDRSWPEFVSECIRGRVQASHGDRAWFVLWERFDESRVAPACSQFYATFRQAAYELKDRVVDAAEVARRRGVYPGTSREIRQRYRLDSSDW